MATLSEDIYERIVSAKIFIDEHLQESIPLEQISKQAYLSKFHFHRIFKLVYKRTPHDYLISKRLDKAKVLLAKEGISITDVCNDIGFESLSSFSLLFKKQNGFSPQYYRNIAYLKNKLARQQPKRFIPHCYIETLQVENSKNE